MPCGKSGCGAIAKPSTGGVRVMPGSAAGAFCTAPDVTCIAQADVWSGNRLVITQPGKYRLCSDIKFNQGVAICIAVSNVTLDFDGHYIDGQGTGCVGVAIIGTSVGSPLKNITVMNGTIRNTKNDATVQTGTVCCGNTLCGCASIYMAFVYGAKMEKMTFFTFYAGILAQFVSYVEVTDTTANGGSHGYKFDWSSFLTFTNAAVFNITVEGTHVGTDTCAALPPPLEADRPRDVVIRGGGRASGASPPPPSAQTNNFYGIFLQNVYNFTICDCSVISGWRVAIFVDGLPSASTPTVDGSRIGIIKNVTAQSNETGLVLRRTECVTVQDSNFSDNKTESNEDYLGNGLQMEDTVKTNLINVVTECSTKNGVNVATGNQSFVITNLLTKNNDGAGVKVPASGPSCTQDGVITRTQAIGNQGIGYDFGASDCVCVVDSIGAANISGNWVGYAGTVPQFSTPEAGQNVDACGAPA